MIKSKRKIEYEFIASLSDKKIGELNMMLRQIRKELYNRQRKFNKLVK